MIRPNDNTQVIVLSYFGSWDTKQAVVVIRSCLWWTDVNSSWCSRTELINLQCHPSFPIFVLNGYLPVSHKNILRGFQLCLCPPRINISVVCPRRLDSDYELLLQIQHLVKCVRLRQLCSQGKVFADTVETFSPQAVHVE